MEGESHFKEGDSTSCRQHLSEEETIACDGAESFLLIPFCFWPIDDLESPLVLAKRLCSRTLAAGGVEVSIWEPSRLPS